jgi:hypothetical protein
VCGVSAAAPHVLCMFVRILNVRQALVDLHEQKII